MNNDFEFKYSAPTSEERREIESIRNSYLENSVPSKLQTLRSMNNKVKNIPTILALVIGIVGTLVFGLGLAMILEWELLIWGIILCVIGIAIAPFAYPIFIASKKHLKDKYAKDIIKLSEELLNDEIK
ncbi:MAG: hypothetical protein IJ301_05965 [Clostridia bacterium]|nr:hypothetical protein [Clostridia bacterium]